MNIRATRNELTILALALVTLLALSVLPAWSGSVFGQYRNPEGLAENARTPTTTASVSEGQCINVEGIVIKRNADTFTVRAADRTETVVVLTDKTTVTTVRKGLFRRDKPSGVSYILRGLRLKVEGVADAKGQLVASSVRFNEEDLRTAQALESRVDPVEQQANSTQALAEANQKRMSEVEENAQKLSGQVNELSAVAGAAVALATNAQTSADRAEADATTANQRINGLDDYNVVNTFTVFFAPGSSLLSREAKKELDEAAASVKSQTLEGWIVEVSGYADSTGRNERNKTLSEQRANAVINYLVTQHNLPLRRVVQPFGYGSENPVASNDTRDGRAQNRRAEIRVLVSKGVSTDGSRQTSGERSARRP
jgi:OOP family OmpA-OmpF porin